jgi:CRP-like cAMP-binding protein
MSEHDDAALMLQAALSRIAPLPASEFEYVRRHAELRTYAAGSTLIDIGERPSRFWFLLSGFLKFFYITEAGREYIKAFTRPGEIAVPLSALLTNTPNTFAIVAVSEARTLALPTSLIPALYERHPVWERIGRVLAEQMAMRKEARERELLLDSAFVRFQRFSERYPELVDWIPQRQIASYIGVTEQALSRLLRDKRAGFLDEN